MIIWVTKAGIDYASVLKMTFPKLQRWHESALEFYQYRLEDLAEIISGNSQNTQENRRNIDPLQNLF